MYRSVQCPLVLGTTHRGANPNYNWGDSGDTLAVWLWEWVAMAPVWPWPCEGRGPLPLVPGSCCCHCWQENSLTPHSAFPSPSPGPGPVSSCQHVSMSACQHHTSPCHSSLGYTSLVQTLLLDTLSQISKESNVIISDKYLSRRWQLEEVIVNILPPILICAGDVRWWWWWTLLIWILICLGNLIKLRNHKFTILPPAQHPPFLTQVTHHHSNTL